MKPALKLLLFRNQNSPSYIRRNYWLYDKFNTALAAGSVNATNAEPVGGARVVTDTNSKISIAGGVLDFATGAAVNDGVRYTSLARLLGKPLITKVVPSDTGGIINVGFDTDTSGAINDRLVFAAAGVLQIVPNGGTAIAVGLYTATTYYVCGIMRATGFWWYIKGGAFTYWTPLYITALGTAAGIPSINVGSATSIFTADNIRVPKRLFIPVPLQSDGFSAATTDGAGNAEANGAVGSVWTGATWGVAGGAASNTPTGTELITLQTNRDMEDTASWNVGNGTIALSTVQKHGGAKSTLLTNTHASSRAIAHLTESNLTDETVQTWYEVSVWLYNPTTGGPSSVNFRIEDMNWSISLSENTKDAWVQKYITYLAYADIVGRFIEVEIEGPNQNKFVYYDDASVKSLSLSTLFRSLSHSSANVIADVAVTRTSGTQAGLVVNLDSAATPANFVVAYLNGNNCRLDKCVAGVYTNMISAAVTYSAGAVLRVVKDGTKYRLFYNNLAVGAETTIADAGIVSNTLHGLFSTYSANSFDNFCVWARGSESQYSGLDAL